MSLRTKRLQKEMIESPDLVWLEEAKLTLRGVRVDVCSHYPFRPPKLFLNETNVKSHLMAQRSLLAPQLSCYGVNLPCMCCALLCGDDNWAPSLTVARAVDDFFKWDALLKNLSNFCAMKHLLRVNDVGAHILQFLL